MENRVIMQVLDSLEYMSMPATMCIEGFVQRRETWPPFTREEPHGHGQLHHGIEG